MYQSQFSKYPSWYTQNYGEFDYNSIMMYWSTAFSKHLDSNDPRLRYTILRKDGAIIYYSIELSSGDKENIKRIYQ